MALTLPRNTTSQLVVVGVDRKLRLPTLRLIWRRRGCADATRQWFALKPNWWVAVLSAMGTRTSGPCTLFRGMAAFRWPIAWLYRGPY